METLSHRPWKMSMATSVRPVRFGPILYPGRLDECMETASALGYEGLEVNLYLASDLDVAAFRQALDQHGLALVSVGTAPILLEDGLYLAHSDAIIRQAVVDRIKGHIKFGSEFGAAVTLGIIRGTQRLTGDGQLETSWILECLRELADYAAAVQTTLLFEAVNRYEVPLFNSTAQALALIESLDRPNVELLLDLFHMNIEDASLGGAIRRAGARLGHLHVADSNRRAPGWGHLNYGEVLEALTNTGYQGWLSAEVLPLPDQYAAARQTIQHLRSLGF